MATMPVQLDEETLIREQVAQLELPKGVRLARVEPSVDWTGDPCWRIYFAVSKRIPLTKRRVEEVGKMKETLRDRLLALNISGWPFVHFLDAR
jgi:hypothetical protein